MRKPKLAVLSLLVVAAACGGRGGDETGRAVEAADTIVTTQQTQDTTIVTHDTTVEVRVDTIRKEGDRTVRDTIQR
jgi:hypothetical protein